MLHRSLRIGCGAIRAIRRFKELLSKNVSVFENLADLRGLLLRGIDVVALSMKISVGTGCPRRVMAALPLSH